MDRVERVINNSAVQPRPYQQRIVSKITQMYLGEYRHEHTGEHIPKISSAMIESPTGSGKTVMALLTAKVMQQQDPDLVIAWVAMRRNLLGQARRENERKGINVENVHWVSMYDNDPDVLKHRRDGKRIMMVVDEAQHDAASSMSHLHNAIKPDLVLGMTATPFRTDRMKLCFEKVIKDCGIHQLIQDGYLAPYHHYTIPEWNAKTVADHYSAEPDRWGKSIFFFLNLDECYQLSDIFHKRGVRHEVVRGGQQKTTDRQLEMFERGEIDCLINCMVLTEGFDCPSLKTAWIRDSSRGPTMQMAGRAFRQHPEFSHKQVVQSKVTSWPFPRTAIPDEQYLWAGDDWRSLKVNPRLNDINLNARKAIASVEVHMPEYIKVRKKPVRLRFNR